MEHMTLNNSNIRVELWIILPPDPVSVIDKVFHSFKFFKNSGWLLQFWACSSSTSPNSEDNGYNLTLKNLPCVSTGGQELNDYRRSCLDKDNCFVGRETKVGNWFAGRAAQTLIADHRTKEFVQGQDALNAEAPGKGQLVFPVFHGQGVWKKLVGIIELVTIVPKESYSEDFEQLRQLLQDNGLQSNYMGKMIKVLYKNDLIKFPLPYIARLTDLHREVTERFEELEQRAFCVDYKDTNGNCYPITTDVDLQRVMSESIPKGETVIRMHVY